MTKPRVRRGYQRVESEAAFQNAVLSYAGYHGWMTYHPPDNRPGRNGKRQTVQAGFPDITLVREDRLLFAELKAANGRVSPAQRLWIAALQRVGAAIRAHVPATVDIGLEAYIWRPPDWPEIKRVLGR